MVGFQPEVYGPSLFRWAFVSLSACVRRQKLDYTMACCSFLPGVFFSCLKFIEILGSVDLKFSPYLKKSCSSFSGNFLFPSALPPGSSHRV